jgi:hypothetical protein
VLVGLRGWYGSRQGRWEVPRAGDKRVGSWGAGGGCRGHVTMGGGRLEDRGGPGEGTRRAGGGNEAGQGRELERGGPGKGTRRAVGGNVAGRGRERGRPGEGTRGPGEGTREPGGSGLRGGQGWVADKAAARRGTYRMGGVWAHRKLDDATRFLVVDSWDETRSDLRPPLREASAGDRKDKARTCCVAVCRRAGAA